jgi:hypothetical protein
LISAACINECVWNLVDLCCSPYIFLLHKNLLQVDSNGRETLSHISLPFRPYIDINFFWHTLMDCPSAMQCQASNSCRQYPESVPYKVVKILPSSTRDSCALQLISAQYNQFLHQCKQRAFFLMEQRARHSEWSHILRGFCECIFKTCDWS